MHIFLNFSHQTRNSSNGEQKRNRTETESSQGNKSDTDAVFTRSISNEGQHEENVHENDDVDALRRNKVILSCGLLAYNCCPNIALLKL